MELKRTLYIITLLLLITTLIQIPYVQATFQIKTDKDTYYPGSKLTFIITGATPNKKVMLELHDPLDSIKHVDELITDSKGSATSTITIPSNWPLGIYTVYAKDVHTGQVASYKFNIVAPPPPPKVTTITLTANTTSILVGGAVEFIAIVKDQYGNIMAGVDVDLIIDGIKYYTRTTDTSGKAIFITTFNTIGTFHVYAYAAGVSSDTKIITVARVPPILTLITLTANATSITQYQTVLFIAYALDQYGVGMAGISLDLYVGGVKVSSSLTDHIGRASFTYTFNIPGTFSVYVVYGIVRSPTITITVAAYIPPPRVTIVSIIIDKTKVTVGEHVTITATVKDQYDKPMANKKVELYVDGTKHLERYTDADGRTVFSYPLTIAGSFKFRVGCEGVYSTEVTVIAEAPPAPPIPPWSYPIIIPIIILLIILALLLILSRRF
ncbi:MAG: hypothetical protein N3E39_02910 [Candidatus Methanomethylicia archaeon]|nr:hypothetical protein [Candidatus Methanomethylicia archaeon]